MGSNAKLHDTAVQLKSLQSVGTNTNAVTAGSKVSVADTGGEKPL